MDDKKNWDHGLSRRTVNMLFNLDIYSREEALAAYKSKRIFPGAARCRNYGWLSHRELASWLGLPEPVQVVCPVCPMCGQRKRANVPELLREIKRLKEELKRLGE